MLNFDCLRAGMIVLNVNNVFYLTLVMFYCPTVFIYSHSHIVLTLRVAFIGE
jgi:hypothetical protein